MKDKILYLVIGMLIGAIITTGVFMLVDKNRGPVRNQGQRNSGTGGFMPEDFSGGTRTLQEDGSVKIEMPDGRTIVTREGQGNGGQGFYVTQDNM